MRLPESENDDGGPNLTPLIDVVFLLLIFFLVATRFDQQEREISPTLAEVMAARPVSAGSSEVVVNVAEDGKYIVLGQQLTEQMLTDVLQAMKRNNPGQNHKVQIRADRNVKFIYPALVMGLCEKEEIDHYVTVLQQRE